MWDDDGAADRAYVAVELRGAARDLRIAVIVEEEIRSPVGLASLALQYAVQISDALAKVYASPDYKKFLEEQYADPNSFEDAAKAPAFVNEQLEDMKKTMATN